MILAGPCLKTSLLERCTGPLVVRETSPLWFSHELQPFPRRHPSAVTRMQFVSKMHASTACASWPPFKSATCLIRCITFCSCGHDDLAAV